MSSSFGMISLSPTTGRPVIVSADGAPVWKVGGVTIDWDAVTAQATDDATLIDDTVVKVGEKALRVGQFLSRVSGTKKYAPYDPAATDGRQTLAINQLYLVNATVKETDLGSEILGVIEGGRVWKARLLATSGTHTLAAGPTYTEVLTYMPHLTLVIDE